MTYTIQGIDFEPRITEDSFSVEARRDAKILIDSFNSYIAKQSGNALNDVLTYSDDLMKLTDGISFEDFKELSNDKEELTRVTKLMVKNLKKYPNAGKVLGVLDNYEKTLEDAKENFLSVNSIIKNNIGKEIMISNRLLLFQTFLLGDIDKIDLIADKPDDSFELEEKSIKILEDFFLSITKLKNRFKISSLTLKCFGLTANQTLVI